MQSKHILCDLSEYGLLKVHGLDAKKFLQGQLTCHLDQVAREEGCFGAHCNPKGRIISLFYLFQLQDTYYLAMPRNMVATALAALKKYAVFFKVVLAEATDSLFLLGYDGPITLPENVAKISLPHSARLFLLGSHENLLPVWEKLKQSAELISFAIWQRLDIIEGIPSVYPETTSKFLPHEINLQTLNAVSFDKGCYTGQEIIARMHYRGKLKTHMQSIECKSDTPILPGGEILWENASATIVAACQEAYNKYYALVITEAKREIE